VGEPEKLAPFPIHRAVRGSTNLTEKWQTFGNVGGLVIDRAGIISGEEAAPRLCLVFEPGTRPDLAAIQALAEGGRAGDGDSPGLPFTVSHTAADSSWAELLAQGLTFDCTGLSPGPGDGLPRWGNPVGLPTLAARPAGEVVSLSPGPHLAGAAGLLPVLRILARLAARLSELNGIAAVVWTPAGSWAAPELFRRSIAEWSDGGAFPALVLTSLARKSNGAMVSQGLHLLIGQELRFEPDNRLAPAAMARLAVRLIHELVQSGPLSSEHDFAGPAGEHLLAVPVRGGSELRILLSASGPA